ncbi:hypothetical protein J5N97_019939 [Dioscorea zingiberensis]|uniref:S-adenosylmethionine synthase n=1 Tax=Dioscorea zingiberensis TaxID=325984 RepID=A0A9D5CH10_9LILI|nr:hypothetical protein J5N97_019939 [Dioscorea zingiberensis]
MDTFLFTSESVNEGHPDKICDQISDAVLDACLEQDPESKVACETCTKTNMVMVFGEITTKAQVDYEKLVRDTCRGIGFTSADVGLDADHCKVLVNVEQQSPDIAQGVHGHLTKKPEEIGAGDQGHMFGYATDETPELMPLTHVLATKLGAKLTEVRKNKTCAWLRPDGKTQVTVEYRNDGGAMVPIRVHTVLISTQHDETVTNEQIAEDLKEHVIKPVIPSKYLDQRTIFHLNPSGRFVIGGPHGDAGLTGRKIIIDTYGGWGAHGGGAFSGKDPTKVDRSGAYIARQAAKSVVASGLARRCIVQVSYAIGVPEPLSVFVDTYKTGKIPDRDILALIKENFDFRPGMIAINLDLKRGGNFRYQKTAAYGHFGRDDPDFTWEKSVISDLDRQIKTKTESLQGREDSTLTPLSLFNSEEEHHGMAMLGRESAVQALNSIIQLHFEKTLEKKHAIDTRRKELWRLFQLFFVFLALMLSAQAQSPPGRLQCRHLWAPVGLLALAHLAFYVAVAQTLRAINGFRYQRRCHKLTLALATDRLKHVKMRAFGVGSGSGSAVPAVEFEVQYQEPPESYLAKFKRSWALHFGFLLCTFGFMASASVVILCF